MDIVIRRILDDGTVQVLIQQQHSEKMNDFRFRGDIFTPQEALRLALKQAELLPYEHPQSRDWLADE
ncbi:hypothetical protein [Mycobacterium arosiense]|uniref:Uncharacterized protein n=1 Tax=Mycobacterium arosiense ATCC BAA-1401 = DSM 45069 TaxID=1265311 RepID=A0A1W9ZQF4_MYCAI|nr:hypothetical protein [Mycobacterium arosiense]ORA20044.1 hypothetical protein BST14_02640 [Mycobacterium arosiense ATCC BAA-1401 = DSM 45069]